MPLSVPAQAGTLQLVANLLIAALSGAFGVGVAWATFRLRMRRFDEELVVIRRRQDHLRGEGEFLGAPSMVVLRSDCNGERANCQAHICSKIEALGEEVDAAASSARYFENFARWFLASKEGLSLPDVNRILNGSRRHDDK